jgi:hypothetical protein
MYENGYVGRVSYIFFGVCVCWGGGGEDKFAGHCHSVIDDHASHTLWGGGCLGAKKFIDRAYHDIVLVVCVCNM